MNKNGITVTLPMNTFKDMESLLQKRKEESVNNFVEVDTDIMTGTVKSIYVDVHGIREYIKRNKE